MVLYFLFSSLRKFSNCFSVMVCDSVSSGVCSKNVIMLVVSTAMVAD